MSDQMFRDLLDWFMVSDPWALDSKVQRRIEEALNSESTIRGFDGWVVAYHEFEKFDTETKG